MSRRRHRSTRARSCTGKHAHPTRQAALAQIHSLRRTDGAVRMAAYECRHCDRWHVGHLPRSKATRR